MGNDCRIVIVYQCASSRHQPMRGGHYLELTNQREALGGSNGWVGATIRYNLPTILANASLTAHRQPFIPSPLYLHYLKLTHKF